MLRASQPRKYTFKLMIRSSYLAMIQSTSGILAFPRGKKHLALSLVHVATYLMYIIFPLMLGPAIICMLDLLRVILQPLLVQLDESRTSSRGCFDSIRKTCSFQIKSFSSCSYLSMIQQYAVSTSSWEMRYDCLKQRIVAEATLLIYTSFLSMFSPQVRVKYIHQRRSA
jgi:hypothetical protein